MSNPEAANLTEDASFRSNHGDDMMEGDHDNAPAVLWTKAPVSSSTDLYQSLQTMEELMQCALCHDFMTRPVSVPPCHHSFCQPCWEDYRQQQQQQNDDDQSLSCPTCQQNVVVATSILSNATLGKIIQTYTTLRAPLKASLMMTASTAETNDDATKEAKPKAVATAKTGRRQKRGRRQNDAVNESSVGSANTSENNVRPCVLQPIVNSQSANNNHKKAKGGQKKPATPTTRTTRQKTDASPACATPPVAPALFPPGSNAPSTIPHELSQPPALSLSSKLDLSQAAHDDALDKIAQAGAMASSPTNDSNETTVPAKTAKGTTKKAASKPPKRVKRTTKRTKSRRTTANTNDPTQLAAPAPTKRTTAGRRGGRSGTGPWTCGMCTFCNTQNVWSTATCEICQTSRTVAETS